MPGARIIIDGLWRSLCPVIDPKTLIRAIGKPLTSQPRPSHHPTPARQICAEATRRHIHATSRQHDTVGGAKVRRYRMQRELPWLTQISPPYTELRTAPTSDIYDALYTLRDMEGQYHIIEAFVKHLLEVRGEHPTPLIYETLIRANCHVYGSADTVGKVLKEMREAKMAVPVTLHHSALRALAVHPDYLLRNSILAEMKERWIELRPEGMQSVAIGLLRDGQYELALDKLEQMVAEGMDVPGWVFEVFIYTFCQAGFHDEALRIVNHRLLKDGKRIRLIVWYVLLDSCGRRLHYEGIKYVWTRMVEPKLVNPSDGICLNVLNAAARNNDADLATHAIQHLSARGTKLGMHHFEALLDCYAGADDIENALQALCIMHNSGFRPDAAATRSVYLSLKRTPSLVDPAVKILFDLRAKYNIPIAAFNVVMEGMLVKGDVTRGFDLYRHVRQLCPAGPNVTTFSMLFEHCPDAHLAHFLSQEMAWFNIKPSADMYDSLIYFHVQQQNLPLAMRFVLDLISVGERTEDPGSCPWIKPRTATLLVKKCFEEEEPRIWDVAKASRARGMPLDAAIRDVLKDIPRSEWNRYNVPRTAALEPAGAVVSG